MRVYVLHIVRSSAGKRPLQNVNRALVPGAYGASLTFEHQGQFRKAHKLQIVLAPLAYEHACTFVLVLWVMVPKSQSLACGKDGAATPPHTG